MAAVFLLAGLMVPALEAGRKGDKAYQEGKAAEVRKDWEKALDAYERAILDDPYHVGYQMAARRVRFQASQARVDKGQKLRQQGKLEDALAEFQKAYSIDPSSSIADQEIRRTVEMIDREKKKGQPSSGNEKVETPVQQAKREIEEKIDSMQATPELRAGARQPITLKMNNQPPKILFETIAKLSGINVIFDTEYQPTGRHQVDLNNASLDQALDYVAIQTKSFWKPLSANTIFVTQDNITKRRDYEDYVVKTFYLSNTTTVQELQEIATAVRSVTEIRRLFTYNGQNAILIRGTVDQVALAEKLISDLDKPKSEVVVDVMVMEISKSKTRDLAASLASGGSPGLNLPVSFTPRNPVLAGGSTSTTSSTGTTGSTSTTGTTSTTGSSSSGSTIGSAISLARIGRISTNDFSLTLPGALFKAIFSDREGRVLQSPQVRAVENQKASLRLGDKIPYATGSFQPGFGSVGAGVSPLVSTQFNFAEVGVNVDITPKVHGADEVSLHVELELSTVRERIDIGGLQQPVIGQRKITHDIRMREGEVNILGGLTGLTDSTTINGIPGVGQVPFLRRLFGSESKERIETELLIALVPHVIRSPEISPANLRGVAAGNDQTIKLSYSAREEARKGAAPTPDAAKAAAATPANPPAAAAPVVAPAATPAAAPATTPAQPAQTPPAAPPAAQAAPPNAAKPLIPVTPPGTATLVMEQTKAPSAVMLTAHVRNATDLFAAPMRIQYDPKILKLVEVVRGPALSPQGEQVNFKSHLEGAAKGEGRIELSRPAGAGGVNVAGPVALFRFEIVGKGSTIVSLTDIDLRDSKNQPIPSSAIPTTVVIE